MAESIDLAKLELTGKGIAKFGAVMLGLVLFVLFLIYWVIPFIQSKSKTVAKATGAGAPGAPGPAASHREQHPALMGLN